MSFGKNKSGWIFVWVLCLFPVVLWFFAPSMTSRFGDAKQIFSSFGKLTALVGVSMYSVTLFLSARLKVFEKYFSGLSEVYERHSQLGQLALILLMFHPLLLLPQYTSSFSEAVRFLLPGKNFALNLGIFSLGLMLFLIFITLYLRPKYNIWKWTHKFLGFAFFLGSFHVWLIPSDTSRFLPLRIYILGLAAFGLLAFFYRTVLGKFLVSKYRYVVSNINKLNDLIVEITLKPLAATMKFIPGQFMFIQFLDPNVGTESHPFSIVSGSGESALKIAVKNLGDYTSKLVDNLGTNSVALIEGPFGVFSYKNAVNKSQVWIAGGVGITPFISMAKSIFLADHDYEIDLFYCFKSAGEDIYVKDLQQIAEGSGGHLRLHIFCSDVKGRIDADYIAADVAGGLVDKDIFMCAPPPMIHALKDRFMALGLPENCVHSEEFNF